jgi:PAS domain S-box-containing protein
MAQSASLGVLLDHTQDKIVLLDEAGHFTYANEAVRRLLGWDPDRLVGEDAFTYIHPDDRAAARAAFQDTISSDGYTESSLEMRYQTREGDWLWVESRMTNLTDDQLDGYVVSSRDITDRVAAQSESRETSDRLRELSETTGEVLWMFDGDWSELLFLNPAFEEVYGLPVGDVEADPTLFLEAVHPDDVPEVRAAMNRLATGESVDMEYRVNPAEDYNTWVWVQAEPIVEDSEVVRITGFSRDVTDRYRRERQLVVMDKLLRHNVRNDLNVVLGSAELIESEFPDSREHTAVIRQTAEDLLASADKERDIIRMLTSSSGPQSQDLRAVAEDCIEIVGDRFPSADIELGDSETARVRAFPELPVALTELLENAIRHAEHSEPAVKVAIEGRGDTAAFVVADNGPPIPTVEAQVLTGEHEMNDIYHSTGLGLWLVYWTVTLSEGSVAVRRGSAGNRVEVTLPTAE